MLGRLLSSPRKVMKRTKQLLYFVSHRADHAEYLRVIGTARAAGVASADKLIDLKYLGIYLSDFMSTETRRQILMHHYAFLTQKITDASKGRLWSAGATLWERHDEETGNTFRVIVEQSALSPMEGESQLRFTLGDTTLCTLTFSVLHGASIGLPHGQVIFIGGVQGGQNCRQEIRVAAKANGEIAPAAILLVAAKAIAQAMGIGHIVGVSSEGQAAMGYAGEKISLSYDAMWLDAGAIQTENGFFIVAPGEEKRLDDIRSKHRARTRRKRQLKLEITKQVRRRTADVFALAEHHFDDEESIEAGDEAIA
jgi:uncharacterized protein VirK/YbjX